MAINFYNEMLQEMQETKRAELRGKLHPRRQIKYTSRVHDIRENLDMVIFFTAVIGGFAFMVFLITVCTYAGVMGY